MDDGPRTPAHVAGYAGAMTAFASGVAALGLLGRSRGGSLPERFAVEDVLLGGLATHKFTRVLSKDAVTTPLRAPFSTDAEAAGSAELTERPREGVVRHAVGELVTCPFCLGPWVATAYVAGLALAPRAARAWAAVFSVVGTSDVLHQVYGRVRTD